MERSSLPQVRHRDGRFLPRLEVLEDRTVPASVSWLNNTLSVHGDQAANTVQITDSGVGISVSIDGKKWSGGSVGNIRVYAAGGNDTVNYKAVCNPLLPAVARTIVVFLDQAETYGAVSNAADTFSASVMGTLKAGSAYSVNAYGGGGNDKMTFSAPLLTLKPSAALLVKMDGQAGADQVSLGFQGKLDGTLWFDLAGGAGSDTVSAVVITGMPGWAPSQGRVGLPASAAKVRGGASGDKLNFTVADLGSVDVFAQIIGNEGYDTGHHTVNVARDPSLEVWWV